VKYRIVAAGLVVGAMTATALTVRPDTTPLDFTPVADVSFPEGTTMARLHDQGHLTIGIKFDQPLVGYFPPGATAPSGFDVEIGRLIAARLGIPSDHIRWVEALISQREQLLADGSVDLVIANYVINDERRTLVDFAGPYYSDRQSLLVPADNPEDIDSPDDVRGQPVCSVEASQSADNVARYGARVVLVPTYSECLPLLRSGDVVAMSTFQANLAGLAWEFQGQFKLVGATFDQALYGIGVAKGDDEFRDWIDGVLAELEHDGEWKRAWQDTLGKVVPLPKPPPIG
jgi:glutamate transport system substrate-binding protein